MRAIESVKCEAWIDSDGTFTLRAVVRHRCGDNAKVVVQRASLDRCFDPGVYVAHVVGAGIPDATADLRDAPCGDRIPNAPPFLVVVLITPQGMDVLTACEVERHRP